MEFTIAYMEAEVIQEMDSTHTVFLGTVRDRDIVSDEEPMTYDYHAVKGGKSPAKDPTYQGEKKNIRTEGDCYAKVCLFSMRLCL